MYKVTCDVCGTEEQVSKFIFDLSIYGHECNECYMKDACEVCCYRYCECY